MIRSKTVPPKEAMRSLKKRIGDKNPNTQLSALNVRPPTSSRRQTCELTDADFALSSQIRVSRTEANTS